MTTNAYITLATSSGSPSCKFRVIEGGYNVISHKAQTEAETIGGIDVAMGAIHESREYVLKIRQGRWAYTSSGSYQMEGDDYGILSDLEYFYGLNNPQGTPTNVITLTDHFNVSHYVYFVGDLARNPLLTVIEGGCALFFIQCRFRVIPS